jgi:hypothetical protein
MKGSNGKKNLVTKKNKMTKKEKEKEKEKENIMGHCCNP